MSSKCSAVVVTLSVSAILVGCQDVYEDGVYHQHQCPTHTNTIWEGANLSAEIDHDDPRSCPVDAPSVGSIVQSAATIKDDNAVHPVAGDPYSLRIEAYEFYTFTQGGNWSGSWTLPGNGNASQEWFVWVWDEDAFEYVWQVYTWIDFGRGDSPDYVEHRVDLSSSGYPALAVVEIDYPDFYTSVGEGAKVVVQLPFDGASAE